MEFDEMNDICFHQPVIYKGFQGYAIAKQLPLEINGMVAGLLVAFPKPKMTREKTAAQLRAELELFAEIFECDPEHLGPCVNRIIPENELTF
jgi:hypothetical protein